MPHLITHDMSRADAREIAHWTYEAPYDLYNLDGSEEDINELLQESYWGVHEKEQGLVGFYCIGSSAQVPAGHEVNAYGSTTPDTEFLDFGIGMRPDLTGQGFGTPFLDYILQDIRRRWNLSRLRLSVATFNVRAIRLYTEFGFESVMSFENNGVAFQTMTVHLKDT